MFVIINYKVSKKRIMFNITFDPNRRRFILQRACTTYVWMMLVGQCSGEAKCMDLFVFLNILIKFQRLRKGAGNNYYHLRRIIIDNL